MATSAQIKAALKNPNKSEGMRELLRAGMAVNEVATAFDAQYGFVYGVARRAGLVTPTPREAKATAKASRPAAKAARPTKAAAAKAPARAAKPAAKSASKAKAKA